MLFAQDRWNDGLYSVPGIGVNAQEASNRSNYPPGIYSSSNGIKVQRQGQQYNFPQQSVLSVYPNPALSDSRAVFSSRETGMPYILYMVSLDGKPLLKLTGSTVRGTNIIHLNMSPYPMGTYFLQLMVGERREIVQLIKADKAG